MAVAAPSPRSFRTLGDALAESKGILAGDGAALMGNLGHSPGVMGTLKNLAMRADPIVDAATINTATTNAVPDDSAAKFGGRIADRMNPDRQLDALKNGWSPDDAGALEAAGKVRPPVSRKPARPAAPAAPEKPGTMETVMGYAGEGLGKVAMIPLATEMLLPGAAWVAGKAQMKGLQNKLGAPGRILSKEIRPGMTGRQVMNDSIQIGFNFLQTAGFATGLFKQLDSLKEMYADVMGVDKSSVSTMTIVSGKMPPVLAETRAHFLKEFASRGLIQAVGWGLVARDFMRAKHLPAEEIAMGRIGITAGIVPGIVSMGVDAVMGTSPVEIYSGFKKAIQSGQDVPVGAYAQFIMANSPDLQKRKVGKQVALELGDQYKKEGASADEMLRRINDGRFKASIEQLIARDEASLAARTGTQSAAAPGGMVGKINGQRQQPGKVVGPFTNRLSQESAMQNKQLQ